LRRFLLLIGLVLTVCALTHAQDEGPKVPVKAVWSTAGIPAGGKADLAVVFDVPKGHHITDVENGLFFVETRDTLGLKFDSAMFPAGTKYKGDRVYQGRVIVRIPATAASDVKPGQYTWPVHVGYQMCQEFGEEICFLPMEKDIDVTATIVPAGTAVAAANADIFSPQAPVAEEAGSSSLEARLIAALNQGSFLAFFLVFIGGILASFTPCVYPVIPITIGYIGGASRSKLHGLWLSFIYVLGISVVYSGLGLLSAATGTLFGSISGSPIVTFTVAAIFAVMGISMLGAFEIALPSSLQSKMQGGGPKKGLLAPLVLGMVSGLVMAPCVGPVIVALLAWVSRSGNLLFGWSLLFVFSLGLGMLFLVLGTFAGAIQALPRAGAWMDSVKHGFGWILLAGALYMLRFEIPEPWNTAAWAILLIVMSVFLGAFDSMGEEPGAGRRLGKAVSLMIFILGAIFMFKAIVPFSGSAAVASKAEVAWMVNQEPEAWAQAQQENKPLLVDVYADWCAACKELDEKTYVVPNVVQRTGGFVRLKLDFTKQNQWVEDMKKKYNITGMPTVMLFDPSGQEITRFTGFKSAPDFVAVLDQHKL
jgi:thiol:disulfide interchange protein DsbD